MAREHGIIWARWRVLPGGRVELVATRAEGGGYRQERRDYESVEAAELDLGPSFGDVVRRAVESGSDRGRWRP